MAVDLHCSLDEFVRTLQEVVPRHHPCVVDQEVDVANLCSDLLSRAVYVLAFTDVTHKGIDLRLERDVLDSSNYFWRQKLMNSALMILTVFHLTHKQQK